MTLIARFLLCVPVLALALGLAGCQSTSETAERDQLTAHVGIYDPPTTPLEKVRVGVPPYAVTKGAEGLADIASDQSVTLMVNTERFSMIERTQLFQLLKEQGLEGIVRNGELARQAQVRGVDFLLLGKVTNFRVKAEKSKAGFGFGNIAGPLGINVGGFDNTNKKSRIKAEVGVDIRLVDPSTGETPVAQFGEYTRTDEIGAIGIEVLGTNAEADAELNIDEDNKGKLLRLALDDAIRKMLPKTDRYLRQRAAEKKPAAAPAPAAPPAPPAVSTPPAPTEPAAKKFCTGCGKELVAGAKFCAGCGVKTE